MKPKTHITVRLPVDLKAHCERLADAEERPLSWWVRRAMVAASGYKPKRGKSAKPRCLKERRCG